VTQGPLRAIAALAALAVVPIGTGLRAQAVVFVGPRATAIPIANPLDTVTVPIVADLTGAGGAALGAITAQLSWRAATLRFLGAGAGAAGVPVLNVDSANGTVRFALATAAGVTGTPVLMQARFQAIGPLGDSTTLGLTVSELNAAGSFAALTPAPTAALVCVGSVAGRWGDLTGDDQVMSNDALAIVTYAVGLPIAPLTPLNGDVDADGAVHTRDALIVLSFVVGLPTPGFRVNQPRPSACGSGSPAASVAVTPGTATLVTGDQLPLAATVRDAGGAIVHANPAWLTRNAAVATVDRAGVVQAVGAGTTRIVVAAAPGIMDSTTVTVGGTRRVWYVNAGASGSVQNGSPQFPFGSIADAVAAAGPNDTLRLAVGRYGMGLQFTGPLVVLGDSTALGFPTIVPVDTTPAVDVDGLTSGDFVAIRRLRVVDAALGIRAHGAGGVLELDRVIVERSRGPGIQVTALDTARLDQVAVLGAVEVGIAADTLRLLWMTGTASDGVAPGTSGQSYSLKTAHVDSLIADSVELRSASVLADTVTTVVFRQSFLGYAAGPILTVRAATTARLDTVDMVGARQGRAGPPAVQFTSPTGATVTLNGIVLDGTEGRGLVVDGGRSTVVVRGSFVRGPRYTPIAGLPPLGAAEFNATASVTIAQSRFEDGMVRLWDSLQTGVPARLDTVTLMGANIWAANLGRLDVRQADLHDADYTMVYASNVPIVHFAGVEAEAHTWRPPGFPSLGFFAIELAGVDSARADSLWVHDNHHGGLFASAVRAFTSYGARFERNNLAPISGQRTTALVNVGWFRMAQALFDERSSAVYQSVYISRSVPGFGAIIDSTTFLDPLYPVYAFGTGALSTDTLIVRGSLARLRGPATATAYGSQVNSFGRVSWLANTVDSAVSSQTGERALNVYNVGSLEVRDSRFLDVRGAVSVQTSGPVDLTGNHARCVAGGFAAFYVFQNGPLTMVSDTVAGRCQIGGYAYNTLSAQAVVMRNNLVSTDTASTAGGLAGLWVYGNWFRPVVVGNDVGPGYWQNGGIALDAAFGAYLIDSARVDSNVVHDGRGTAVRTNFGVRRFQMRGNTLERTGIAGFSPFEAGIMVDGGAVSDTNRLTDNRIRQNRTMGIYLNTSAPTRLDSTVIVDDSTIALFVQTAGNVVGTSNFLARNRVGIQSTGTLNISQSVIQQHDTVGARGGGSMTLANNWWGDASGPRCGASCPGALGDSVAASVIFAPFLTAPPSTPTGAPPVRPVAASSPDRVPVADTPGTVGATRTVGTGRWGGVRARPPAPREELRLATGERRRLTGGRP